MNFEPTNISIAVINLVIGLILLFKSADWLVHGAVSFARRLGVSPLVIGLTIVAMGTSAPEVAASVISSIKGAGDLAIGNVYGSNIANLALIGGVCALIRPLTIKVDTLKREIPIMLIVAVALFPFIRDLELSFINGFALILLFLGLMIYTVFNAMKQAKKKPLDVKQLDREVKIQDAETAINSSLLLIFAGVVSMAFAAKIMVDGGVFLGRYAGLSEAVIGMTIIAIGTSLPELITCGVAAVKGHDDISIGNLVGSNIFNTLLVTGVAGICRPFKLDAQLAGSYFWMMIGASLLFTLLIWHKKNLGRVKGMFLLGYYAFYMFYLFFMRP